MVTDPKAPLRSLLDVLNRNLDMVEKSSELLVGLADEVLMQRQQIAGLVQAISDLTTTIRETRFYFDADDIAQSVNEALGRLH